MSKCAFCCVALYIGAYDHLPAWGSSGVIMMMATRPKRGKRRYVVCLLEEQMQKNQKRTTNGKALETGEDTVVCLSVFLESSDPLRNLRKRFETLGPDHPTDKTQRLINGTCSMRQRVHDYRQTNGQTYRQTGIQTYTVEVLSLGHDL